MKKTLAFVLALVLLLSLGPMALAASDEIDLYTNGDQKWIGSWGVPILYPESSITDCTGLEFHYGYSNAAGRLGDHDLYILVNGGWIKYGTFNVPYEGDYYSIWVSFQKASTVGGFAVVPKNRTTSSYNWGGYVDNVIGGSTRSSSSSSSSSGSSTSGDLSDRPSGDYLELYSGNDSKSIGSWTWPIVVPEETITNCISLTFHYGYSTASGKLGEHDLYIKVNGGWIKYGSFNISRENQAFSIRVTFDKASTVDAFVVLPHNRNTETYYWDGYVSDIVTPSGFGNSRSSSSSSSSSGSSANSLDSRPSGDVVELYYGNDTKWIGSWGVPMLVPDYTLYNCSSFTFNYGYYSSAGQLGDHDLYIRVNDGWIKYGTFNVPRENEAFSIWVSFSNPSKVDAFALVPKNRSVESYSWDGYLTNVVTR